MNSEQLWPDAYVPREDAEAAVAEWKQRAEAAEAKLAAADEYGQYADFQGRLNAPIYKFEIWWRWRAERLAQSEVQS